MRLWGRSYLGSHMHGVVRKIACEKSSKYFVSSKKQIHEFTRVGQAIETREDNEAK